MTSSVIHVLFIADIVGKPGMEAVTHHLPELKEKYNIHLTIANGENCASGKGLTLNIAESLFSLGVDVITSGNHIWNRESIIPHLDQNPSILRPLNYPKESPGKGSFIIQIKNKQSIGVINLQGRSFMYSIDCPFKTITSEIERLKKKGVRSIIVDFHAEATAEKIALGWYLDGQVSAVIGTHTHVQTADERILPGGTAYITDAGMTGPYHSVIGMDKDASIRRFITQLPVHYKMAHDDIRIAGVIIDLDIQSGRALSISRYQLEHP